MKSERIFNFSAGPAVLPVPVLEQAQRDLVSLPDVGMSILEVSHRSKVFEDVLARAWDAATTGDDWMRPALCEEALRIGSRIVSLQHALAARVSDLQQALQDVKRLGGLLPICAYCKRIRDDGDYWKQIEQYLSEYSEAQFSHGICPQCLETHLQQLTR